MKGSVHEPFERRIMKKKFIPLVIAVATLMASCNHPSSPTTSSSIGTGTSQVAKYTVTANSSEDFEVTGLEKDGYAEGATVTFRVNVKNALKEVERVIVDKKALTPAEDGTYSFTMGAANVVINITLKDKEGVKTVSLELSNNNPGTGDEVTVTMKLDGTAVTEDVTLEATKGADLVQINGVVVKCLTAGEVTIKASATVDGIAYEKTTDFTIVEGVKLVTIASILQTQATYSGKNATYAERISIEGRVVNINYNGPVIYDGTGVINAYTKQLTKDYPDLNLQVGDYVRVSGTPTRYKASDTDERGWQFTCYNTTEKKLDVSFQKLSIHEEIALPELTDDDFTAEDLTAYQTSATGEVRYVQFTAKASISGTHVNLLLKQADGNYLNSRSISYYNNGVTLTDGVLYRMKAFLSDLQQGKYLVAYVVDETVERIYDAATAVTISGPKLLLLTNTDGIQLSATVSPDTANPKVTWSSLNEDIATVDENGLVKPLKAGDATIKAAASDTVYGTYVVKVSEKAVAATAVAMSQATANLKLRETLTLTATPTPEDTTDILEWSSENPAIASVDENGVVTGVSAGTVNIKATYGSVNAVCAVTVINQYGTLDAPVDVKGALQVGTDECKTDKAYSSKEVYVIGKVVTPGTYSEQNKNYTGMVLQSLEDPNVTLTVYRVLAGEGVDAPEANDIVKVHGYMQKYGTNLQMSYKDKSTPTIYANENGSSNVTSSGEHVTFNGLPTEAVANGTSVSFTVTVESGYILDNVSVNKTKLDPDSEGKYTFTVSGDMAVEALTHKEGEVAASEYTYTTIAQWGWTRVQGKQESTTADGVVLKQTNGSFVDEARIYKSSTFTISLSDAAKKIYKVEFTCTKPNAEKEGPGGFSLKKGEVGAYTYSGFKGTWAADEGAASVSLVASGAQVRITSITITVK